jgi:hypothetical protein
MQFLMDGLIITILCKYSGILERCYALFVNGGGQRRWEAMTILGFYPGSVADMPCTFCEYRIEQAML